MTRRWWRHPRVRRPVLQTTGCVAADGGLVGGAEEVMRRSSQCAWCSPIPM